MLVSQVKVFYECPKCDDRVSTQHLQGFCDIKRIRDRYWRRCSKCGAEMIIAHACGNKIKNEEKIESRPTGIFHG